VKGHPRLEWVKPPGKRNEALDCAVYALAGAHMLHMDRWRDGDWQKWQGRVETRDLFDVAAEPASEDATAPRPEATEQALPLAAPMPATAPAQRTRRRGQFGGSKTWR